MSLREVLADFSRHVCKETDFLGLIQQWPCPSEIFLTPRFNNRTGFLANDPLSSAVVENSRRREVSQRDKSFTIP